MQPPGGIDPSLVVGIGTRDQIRAVAVDSRNRLVIAGSFTSFNGTTAGQLIRLLENGSVDPDFNAGVGANSEIKAVEILADGRILLGGVFTTFGTKATRGLVLLDSNGAIDPTFTSRFNAAGFSAGMSCLEAFDGR